MNLSNQKIHFGTKYEAFWCPQSAILCPKKAKHQRYMTLNLNLSTHSGPILKQSLSGSRYATNTTENTLWQKILGLGLPL